MKKEKKLNNSVEPVSILGTKTILNQMMNCICKLNINGANGTGFFCKIPFENNYIRYFLITNYHVLNEKYYNENNKINLLLNDEDITKIIDLRMNRITYFNENYDITLIELNENDNINNFLELDDKLFRDNHEIIYENKSLYILQYPLGKNAAVSYGLLTSIDKFEIKHKCSTENGSSGSPILNLETNKVIGIHKEGSTLFEFNKGTYLKYPLNDFIQINKNNNNNFTNNIYQFNNNMQNNNINFNDFNIMNNMMNLNLNNQIKLNNNQINSFQKQQKVNIFKSGIIYPHQAGIQNIGQSKYMNATIECLSNIRRLSNNLLQKYGTFDSKEQPLSFAYSSFIYELFHTREKFINPHLFKEILEILIKGNQVYDAKDLLIFIIETIHKELLPPINNDNQLDLSKQEIEIDSCNKMIVLQNFIKEFSRNQTIISNIFYGIIQTQKQCQSCRIKNFSFHSFNSLNFPLEKIKKYKLSKIGNKNLYLNLYDAFHYKKEVKDLKWKNMYYCNACEKYTECYQKQDCYTLPPILVIILNRGKNNQDFNEYFLFDETLDLSNFVQYENSWKKYFLSGIITQLGKSGYDEHFVAYCRNNINDNFICYNDDSVTQVTIKEAMSSRISEKEYENIIPYILFYHFMK